MLLLHQEAAGIDIEYEVLSSDQEPLAARLREYAEGKGWRVTKSTYGNPMEDGAVAQAPLYRLHMGAGIPEASRISREIAEEVLVVSPSVVLDVVP